MSTPNTLSPDPEMLEDWAGSEVFDRGEQLLDAVSIIVETPTQVQGFVQGTQRYTVSFRLHGGQIQAHCSCPHFGRGYFCKHLVAFGLVISEEPEDLGVLSFDDASFESGLGDVQAVEPETVAAAPQSSEDPVWDVLEFMDREELLTLMAGARVAVPQLGDFLQQLIAASVFEEASQGVAAEDIETYLKNLITDACRVGAFVDYHRSGEVADRLGAVLDEIEALVLAGHRKVLIKQVRRFVDRISKILEWADDSNGDIGGVLYHANELHTLVCTTGEADPNKLVDWILKVQLEGPGWPEVTIAEFWPSLTDRSRDKYRRALEKALENADHEYSERSIRHHLVDYADAAQDVDLAVQHLIEAGNLKEAYYRLMHAERIDEAGALFEQMLGEWEGMPGHRLSTEEIVDKLLLLDRAEEAEQFARKELKRHQKLENYLLLVRIGEHTGRDLRAEARELVTYVIALQNVLMYEGDTEALWELVYSREPNWIPDAVVGYFEKNDPDKALKLLIHMGSTAAGGPADKSTYKAAAGFFRRAKKLSPASLELSRTIAEVRQTHYRRTSMLKIFDQHGL